MTAELLGRHSHFADVPIECRFHCNPNGLADVVSGRATPEEFVRKLRTYWWHRVRTGSRVIVPAGVAGRARLGAHRVGQRLGLGHEESRVRGLHQIIDRDRFDAAVARFEQTHGDDLLEASRRLFYDLLEPLRASAGKPALVEMSCFTIAAAPELARIFPEARFVHSVRDGRDSGASKATSARRSTTRPTPPRGSTSGRTGCARRSRACGDCRRPIRSAFTSISLDELVSANRDGAYGGLLDFLGVDDEPAMREFFDTSMTAEAANQGRWREGLDAEEQREVTARYEATLGRLEREDYHCAPLLRRTYELTLAPQRADLGRTGGRSSSSAGPRTPAPRRWRSCSETARTPRWCRPPFASTATPAACRRCWAAASASTTSSPRSAPANSPSERGPGAAGRARSPAFRASYDDDPIDSSRALFWSLLSAAAEGEPGQTSWTRARGT